LILILIGERIVVDNTTAYEFYLVVRL